MAIDCDGLKGFQAQVFPSWRSMSVSGVGAQSVAASKAEGSPWETAFGACAPTLEADHPCRDGKTAARHGMLVCGGGHGR